MNCLPFSLIVSGSTSAWRRKASSTTSGVASGNVSGPKIAKPVSGGIVRRPPAARRASTARSTAWAGVTSRRPAT